LVHQGKNQQYVAYPLCQFIKKIGKYLLHRKFIGLSEIHNFEKEKKEKISGY